MTPEPTAEQRNVAAALTMEYGQPDRIMIEKLERDEGRPGLVYMAWFKQSRILFIKPDGKRQLFEGVQKSPGNLL